MTLMEHSQNHFQATARILSGLTKTVPAEPDWGLADDRSVVVTVPINCDGFAWTLVVRYWIDGRLIVSGVDDEAALSLSGQRAPLDAGGWMVETSLSQTNGTRLASAVNGYVGRLVCG